MNFLQKLARRVNGDNGHFKTPSPKKAMQHANVKQLLGEVGSSYASTIAHGIAPYPISELRGWQDPTVTGGETERTLEFSIGHPVRYGSPENPGFYISWMKEETGLISVEALQKELATDEKRAYLRVEGWRKGEKTKPSRFNYFGETDGAVEEDTLRQYVTDAMKVVLTGNARGLETYGRKTDYRGAQRNYRSNRTGPVRVKKHTRGLPRR